VYFVGKYSLFFNHFDHGRFRFFADDGFG